MRGPSSSAKMKGPTDINNLLDGLKAKKDKPKDDDNGSTISISELKELQNEGTLPENPKENKNLIKLLLA